MADILIDKLNEGARIDAFLADHFSISKTKIHSQIDRGKYLVNGNIVKRSFRLKNGNVISSNEDIESDIIEIKKIAETSSEKEKRIELEQTQKKLSKSNADVKYLQEQLEKLEYEISISEKGKQDLIAELEKTKKQIAQRNEDEKTKVIGKYDDWTQTKIGELQKNAQQQFLEYQKLLAKYENDIDRLKNQQKKPVEIKEKTDEHTIPEEERSSTPEEYENWLLMKLEELDTKTKQQFIAYENRLELYKKQLEKLTGNQQPEGQPAEKEEETSVVKKNISIIEDIKRAFSEFWTELKTKENRTLHTSGKHRFVKIQPKTQRKIVSFGWIFCILLFVFAVLSITKYIFK